jgi:acyl carrier protein
MWRAAASLAVLSADSDELKGRTMTIRTTILEELTALFEEDDLVVPELDDDTLLLETDLDSLGFAVLVTRLDELLGYDPFSVMDEAVYPATLKEFVDLYERFAPDATSTS